MKHRKFQLGDEWCIVHYPERPNGFAVMILGDHDHYVDQKNSFWLQQEGKRQIVEQLTSSGYLVLYSNLYGANWGSEASVQLAKRLYQYVKRSEIINGKIHILAEGMGALVLKNLYPMMENEVRSIVLFSPCVSLYTHYLQEKEQKFFFKKLLKEVSVSFDIQEGDCEFFLKHQINDDQVFKEIEAPIYIVQWTSLSRYKNQFSLIKEVYQARIEKEKATDLFYVIPEKRNTLGNKFISYFTKHETQL